MTPNDPTGSAMSGLLDEPSPDSPDMMQESAAAAVLGTEPTGVPALAPGDRAETDIAAAGIIPIGFRTVSGRYRGSLGSFQVELRVDVDRTHPMMKVSGDFYSATGSTITYFGSFIVNTPVVATTTTAVTALGTGHFTFAAGYPLVQVTIQRRRGLQPSGPAVLQFFATSRSPGATYNCAFESSGFRSVLIETDSVSDVVIPLFTSYNTGSLPSGGTPRALSVVSAYAEAGIEMMATTGSDVIDVAEAGATHTWSDSELHTSMMRHFSMFRDVPRCAAMGSLAGGLPAS
jgi:hypothetical protein